MNFKTVWNSLHSKHILILYWANELENYERLNCKFILNPCGRIILFYFILSQCLLECCNKYLKVWNWVVGRGCKNVEVQNRKNRFLEEVIRKILMVNAFQVRSGNRRQCQTYYWTLQETILLAENFDGLCTCFKWKNRTWK